MYICVLLLKRWKAFIFIMTRKDLYFIYVLQKLKEWAGTGSWMFNINDNKLLFFPFFVCTANGNRTELFEIFLTFYANKDGIIEKDIEANFSSNKYSEFEQIDVNSKLSELGDRTDVILENFRFIDTSINHLKGINNQLIAFDYSDLSSISKSHSSWKIYNAAFNSAGIEDNTLRQWLPISRDLLIKEKSQLASSSELISI